MTTHYSQNQVSEAIWPWQKPVSSQQDVPHLTIAILAFSISMFVFIAARFFPKGYVVIERFFKKFSAIVGGSLTWLCLVPFFYICFPIGKIAQILKKKDPMHRKLDSEAGSYWQTCKERESVEDYKRQF